MCKCYHIDVYDVCKVGDAKCCGYSIREIFPVKIGLLFI